MSSYSTNRPLTSCAGVTCKLPVFTATKNSARSAAAVIANTEMCIRDRLGGVHQALGQLDAAHGALLLVLLQAATGKVAAHDALDGEMCIRDRRSFDRLRHHGAGRG